MKQILITLITSILLISGTAVNALDCKLSGVNFSGLNKQQVKVLSKYGGKCTQNTSSFKFGDKSYFIIDGKRLDFIDIRSEDPYDLYMKKFLYTGYLSYFSETERNKVWGYRFDANVIDWGGNSNEDIPLLAVANPQKQSAEEAKSERKAIFKFLNKAKSREAIVQLTGLMRNFSNSGDLYLELDTYKIIKTRE